MKEIEVKILEVNVEEVVRHLKELHAEKTFEGELDVIFYDYPDQYFKKQNKRLRLRRGGDIVELTFKKKLSEKTDKVAVAEEFQVEVTDFETMRTILGELNMVEVRHYKKRRQTWALRSEKMVFTVDVLMEGIPAFMEIEGPSEEIVYEWVRRFGFQDADARAWSGSDVLRHYGVEPVAYAVVTPNV